MATITLTLNYDGRNQSVKQILDGLIASGVFSIKKADKDCPYNAKFMKTIDKSRKDIKKGKGISIKTSNLWK